MAESSPGSRTSVGSCRGEWLIGTNMNGELIGGSEKSNLSAILAPNGTSNTGLKSSG